MTRLEAVNPVGLSKLLRHRPDLRDLRAVAVRVVQGQVENA